MRAATPSPSTSRCDAQAKILRATAEAQAIQLVSNPAESYFKDRAEVSKRLDVLRDVLARDILRPLKNAR